MSPSFVVTKMEVARRQLRTAIELWFVDGDPISVHALAAAAHQIVHDLNRHNKGPTMLLDSSFIKPEHRREFVATVKGASNFMKHADRGPTGQAKAWDFNPESNEHFIMFAICGLRYLKEKLGPEEIAFEGWQILQHPEVMTDAGKAAFKDLFTIENLSALRAMPKQKFFERICFLHRQGQLPKHGSNLN
jgi:hypothetical protein